MQPLDLTSPQSLVRPFRLLLTRLDIGLRDQLGRQQSLGPPNLCFLLPVDTCRCHKIQKLLHR